MLRTAVLLLVCIASAKAAKNCRKNFPDDCPSGQFCAAPGNSQNPSQFKCYNCPCNITPQQCFLNGDGNVECDCAGSGFTGLTCSTDIDECTDGSNNCSANAQCTNTQGGFTCACNAGFSGNGVTCDDINECTSSPSPCDTNASCQNSLGSFSCTCNTGYTGAGTPGNCDNVNECVTLDPACPTGYACQDTTPGFCCNPAA